MTKDDRKLNLSAVRRRMGAHDLAEFEPSGRNRTKTDRNRTDSRLPRGDDPSAGQTEPKRLPKLYQILPDFEFLTMGQTDGHRSRTASRRGSDSTLRGLPGVKGLEEPQVMRNTRRVWGQTLASEWVGQSERAAGNKGARGSVTSATTPPWGEGYGPDCDISFVLQPNSSGSGGNKKVVFKCDNTTSLREHQLGDCPMSFTSGGPLLIRPDSRALEATLSSDHLVN